MKGICLAGMFAVLFSSTTAAEEAPPVGTRTIERPTLVVGDTWEFTLSRDYFAITSIAKGRITTERFDGTDKPNKVSMFDLSMNLCANYNRSGRLEEYTPCKQWVQYPVWEGKSSWSCSTTWSFTKEDGYPVTGWEKCTATPGKWTKLQIRRRGDEVDVLPIHYNIVDKNGSVDTTCFLSPEAGFFIRCQFSDGKIFFALRKWRTATQTAARP